jgi:DNA polymerase III subunit delta'
MMPVADAQGALPLPWLAAPLAEVLAHQRGHATLVHGAPGVGHGHHASVFSGQCACSAS